MGVALKNARLFDETKRLLADADERAAELAIINEVQQGLAAQLEIQAMYDLVGDRLREIFDAQVLDIGILDKDGRADPLPVHDRARRPLPGRADRALRVPQARMARARAAARQRGHQAEVAPRHRPGAVLQGEAPSRPSGCRSSSAARRRASSRSRTSTASTRSPSRTSASCGTIASSLSVALENARLFDETSRLLRETDERAAQLAIITTIQQGLAAQIDIAGDVRPRRRPARRAVRRAGLRHRHPRPRGGRLPLPVHDRARGAVRGHGDALPRHPQARHGVAASRS